MIVQHKKCCGVQVNCTVTVILFITLLPWTLPHQVMLLLLFFKGFIKARRREKCCNKKRRRRNRVGTGENEEGKQRVEPSIATAVSLLDRDVNIF